MNPSLFTPEQVKLLCGGAFPHANGFDWPQVNHFIFEAGLLQPYAGEILPGPGIKITAEPVMWPPKSVTLPKSAEELTPPERTFYDWMERRISAGTRRFLVPQQLTQGECDRVAHGLTLLRWHVDEIGRAGKPGWALVITS